MITVESGPAALALAPETGGAVASFRVDGLDVLRPATPQAVESREVRAFACYPLVPYSNRIAHARLRVGSAVHELERNLGKHPHAIHGVGWQRPWTVVAREAARTTIAFEHRPERDGALAWPFAFRAWQSFALDGRAKSATLAMTIGIANLDARPFPFGLGFHPFFPRWPGTLLAFRASALWRTDGTRLPTERTAIPAEWRFDPPRTADDVDIDNVFTGWDGHASIAWPDGRRSVRIDADRALDHLVVYVPRGQPYLAVEPVTHMTDAFNRHATGAAETGTRVLEAGQSFSCTMRLIVASA